MCAAITVLRKAGRWSSVLPRAEQEAKRISRTVLREMAASYPSRKTAKVEISVVLADDAFVRELNHTYRGKNKPTNVLSFAGDNSHLGDIVLALETLKREAKAQNKRFGDHFTHLLVHGLLHLFGYDHHKKAPAKAMESLEIAILRKLGIENPYRAD